MQTITLAPGDMLQVTAQIVTSNPVPSIIPSPTSTPSTNDDDFIDQLLQSVVDSDRRGGYIKFPSRDITLTRTHELINVREMIMEGDGGLTRFLWAGPKDQPMFRFHLRDSQISNFRVQLSNANVCSSVIELTNVGTGIDPGHNELSHLVFDGTNGGFQCGVRICGINANNDFNHFNNCNFGNYSGCAASIENQENVQQFFTNCQFYGFGGRCAIAGSIDALKGSKSSFVWQAGYHGYHTDADFFIQDTPRAIYLNHVDSEGSNRFVRTSGPSGAGFGLFIENARWASNGMAADGEFIQILQPGIVTLKGSMNLGSEPSKKMAVRWQSFDGYSFQSFVIEDVSFTASDVTFPAKTPTIRGACVQNSDTSYKVLGV